MLETIDNTRLEKEIRSWTRKHGTDRESMIAILHEVHRRYSHVPEYAMELIAEHLDIHPVEVYGVASFYSFFNTRPKGRRIVRLCRSQSCFLQGRDEVAAALEKLLGIKFGETTPDGEYTLEYTSCLGQCDQGPALFVNTTPHVRVTPEKLPEILEMKKGKKRKVQHKSPSGTAANAGRRHE